MSTNATTEAEISAIPVAPGVPSPPSNTPSEKETSNPTDNEKTAKAWDACLAYAKTYADDEIDVWKDELDKLLIFAGLFGGIVSSFAIEAYHSAQEDPAETTALLLKNLLILQLNATNPQPTLAGVDLNPQAPISAAAKRMTIYHFLSLILTLSVAIAGIVCLQWIREYGRNIGAGPGPRREHLWVRFMRGESLERWHVFTILGALPPLLILALLLFFVGLVELLFQVDITAAIVALVVVGSTFMFILVTTLLPALRPHSSSSQCPYKSPQSWAFYQARKTLSGVVRYVASLLQHDREKIQGKIFKFWSWSDYDWDAYTYLKGWHSATFGPRLYALGKMYLQDQQFAEAFYQCIQDKSIHRLLRRSLHDEDERREASIARVCDQETGDSVAQEREKEERIHEMTVFQTLAHLAESIEQGEPSSILLNQRLDLFLKINEGPYPDFDVDCPLMSIEDLRDLITPHMRRRLLLCMTQMLYSLRDEERCSQTYALAIYTIIGLEFYLRDGNLDAFSSLGSAMNAFKWGQRDIAECRPVIQGAVDDLKGSWSVTQGGGDDDDDGIQEKK